MKFKNIAICAAVCGFCVLFGCSAKDKDPAASEISQIDSTAPAVTSIVTVTDDDGKNITDASGNAVTSIVTQAPQSENDGDAQFVTSVSETVVTQAITVTDKNGEAVTDSNGKAETEIVTSISQIIVTVKPTNPQTTTTTAKTTANSKNTTTKAATTTLAKSTTTANITTSAATTTTTSQAQSSTVLHFSDIDYPAAGDCIGTISIPVVGTEMDLYFGDTTKILRKGVGLYYLSYLPGYEGKTIMCGHNSAGYLADWVNYAKSNDVIGEQILISTTYGDYVYEIYETAVLDSSDARYFTNSYSSSTLILYSCMESDYTNERIYFVAKKLSGPVLMQ